MHRSAAVGATVAMLGLAALAGCAGTPDRFYTLNTSTGNAAAPRPAITTHVVLDVTVPSMVDRSEMVLQGATDDVVVLQHERWAAPFADEVSQTLARNIESRRRDVIVADRRFETAGTAEVKVQVDIVQVIIVRRSHVMLEAHWHITDLKAGTDTLDSGQFDASPDDSSYSAIARAISSCLSALGDRIADGLPAR